MGGHKKRAVNDKYYRLAKETGYRARSSFKLVQLNRKYDLLTKATKVIDLCAAPGGWMQVCEKVMPKSAERKIIGVDLLPIKPIRGCVAMQADITTDKCRQMVRKEMNGQKAQVVLCDGAPNVGADYSKDAFVQNELTIHALKFACEHLVRGGSFVTKVFRSSDYNSLMWTFEKLFRKVEATKPASSRNVSAEIFVVCRDFLAPHKIDPRMLDPKYVLDHVEANHELTEASAVGELFKKVSKKKRNREGYDDSLGQTMHRSISAAEFIAGNEPVKMLATANEIHFKDDESKKYLEDSSTTEEIKEFLSDLKVLGNAEFRLALRWRSNIRAQEKESRKAVTEADLANVKASKKEDGSDSEGDSDSDSSKSDQEDSDGIDEVEEAMQRVKAEQKKKKKRDEKKKRLQRAKHQRRVDLGMETEFVHDLGEMDGPFSASAMGLKSVKKLGQIESLDENALPALGQGSESESGSELSDLDEDDLDFVDVASQREAYLKRLEEEASFFHKDRKSNAKVSEPLSVRERRQQLQEAKKAKMKKRNLEKLAADDFTKALEDEEAAAIKAGGYHKLLESDPISDDDGNEDMDSDSEVDDLTKLVEGQRDASAEEAKRSKRWFQQSIFDGVDESDQSEQSGDSDDDNEDEDEDASDDESDEDLDVPRPSDRTDKAKRKIKRSKLKIRNERKAEKRKLAAEKEAKALNPDFAATTSGFETVPGAKEKEKENTTVDDDEEGTSVKPGWARKLIRKGMGTSTAMDDEDNGKFEVVKADPVRSLSDSEEDDSDMEEEKYNSEDYDTDERAQHLALGAMLVTRSKRRKLLDSAYNRYAFNDPEGLPDWFVEDENQHHRPQLPITKEMVDAVKARYKDLAARPINKVAEARARKRRRLVAKVEKIKKQAAAVAEEPDISNKSKMRQIEKLYKGAQVEKPNQVYVVARKSAGGKLAASGGGSKVKIVDKRMKADMRRRGGKKATKGRQGKVRRK
mmetsp:Transcript_14076/g.26052  ORF Transcript_14076/g.26052 Transcript_14076/m.26052 type:complete len:976 (-) Transcript_14076:34-2961(-)